LISLMPAVLLAQLTADETIPFGRGNVIELPGSLTYLDDLPHAIDYVASDFQSHTIGGIQVPLVGWTDPLGQSALGIHASSPGVVFEGIPYPLNTTASLNLLPFSGDAEVFNFPTSAWWGSKASNGSIQFTAPEEQSKTFDSFSVSGGSQAIFSMEDQFKNSFVGLDANYRHGNSPVLGQTDQFNFISKESWIKNDDVNFGSGFLGTQGYAGDYWYSTYLNVDIKSPNFQTLQFKPYFQTVQAGSQSVQEVGGFLNYLFNLAGLAESHLGLGFNSDGSSSAGLAGTHSFLQSTNLVDVLGDVTMDAAFRWDFSSSANTAFSTILGIQGTVDSFVFMGDYDKAVSPITFQDVQRADLGFRFQPNDSWNGTLKYVLEQVGTSAYNGAQGQLQMNTYSPLPFVNHLQINLEEQVLVDQNSTTFYDSGGTLKISFARFDEWWLTGRCLSGEAVFLESGLACAISKELKVYGSVENIAGIAGSVPDFDQPAGTVLSAGFQGTFY